MTASTETKKPSRRKKASQSVPKQGASTLEMSENLMDKLKASPRRFFNRELSWLNFNTRVLEEAENPRHPLLERLRFLSISANNLDEFFMVRVAGLREYMRAGVTKPSLDGLTPSEQITRINERAGALMREQQRLYISLSKELRETGIEIIAHDELKPNELTALEKVFVEKVFPLLTPLAIDPAHPFPFIPNLGFAIGFTLQKNGVSTPFQALVPLPTQVDRFIELPEQTGSDGSTVRRFISLENTIPHFLKYVVSRL